jgi:glycine hydroxymethyltransferase
MKESDMETVAAFIDKVLMNADDESVIKAVKGDVQTFMKQFPLYPELG